MEAPWSAMGNMSYMDPRTARSFQLWMWQQYRLVYNRFLGRWMREVRTGEAPPLPVCEALFLANYYQPHPENRHSSPAVIDLTADTDPLTYTTDSAEDDDTDCDQSVDSLQVDADRYCDTLRCLAREVDEIFKENS